MSTESLFAAAVLLPEPDRIRLVERLLETLDPGLEIPEGEDFAAELKRRSAEIEQGTAGLLEGAARPRAGVPPDSVQLG